MPALADVPLKFALVLTEGKTVAEVVRQLEDGLRGTELEPEWLNAANFPNDDNEAMFGPKTSRLWPVVGARERFAVSMHRGQSEGWIVCVDRIGCAGEAPRMVATVQKLITAKTLSQRHGWQLVLAITRMLDVA
ncbi:hypothetical protein E1J61_26940 [Cupriavidus sp. L7L]|nr:hypothetical protein E1J61_26940 [Cupriavidus sp. L7L]